MTSYTTQRVNQPDQFPEERFGSDLVVDVRLRKLLCGLALIPGLYRFLCVLRNRQIQTVYASSERCQSVGIVGTVQDGRSLVLVNYAIEVVCIAAHYLRCIRAFFRIHDRVRKACKCR
jgi:hypothetical protein